MASPPCSQDPTLPISSSDSSNGMDAAADGGAGGPGPEDSPDGTACGTDALKSFLGGLSADFDEYDYQDVSTDSHLASDAAPQESGGPAQGAAEFSSHREQLLTIVRESHRHYPIPNQVPVEEIAQLIVVRYGAVAVVKVLPTRDVDVIHDKMIGDDPMDIIRALCGLFRLRRFVGTFPAGVPQLLQHRLFRKIIALCYSDEIHVSDAAWRTLSQLAFCDPRFCSALFAAPALLHSLTCLVQSGAQHCGASGCERCPSHSQTDANVTTATSHTAFCCPHARCGSLRLFLALAWVIDISSIFPIPDMDLDALLASIASGLRTANKEFLFLAAHLLHSISLSHPGTLAAVPDLARACAEVLGVEEAVPAVTLGWDLTTLGESKRLLAHAFSRVGLSLDPALHDICRRIVGNTAIKVRPNSATTSGGSASIASESLEGSTSVPFYEEGIHSMILTSSAPAPQPQASSFVPDPEVDSTGEPSSRPMSVATLSISSGSSGTLSDYWETNELEVTHAPALGDSPEVSAVSELLAFINYIYDTHSYHLLPRVFKELSELPRDADGGPSATLFVLYQYGFVNSVYRILTAADESVGAMTRTTGPPTLATHALLFTDSRTQTALCENGFLEVLLLFSLRVRGTLWLQQAAGLHLLSALTTTCRVAQTTLRTVYSVMLIPHIQLRLGTKHAGVVFQAIGLLREFIRGNASNQRLVSSQLSLDWLHNFLCLDDEHAFPSRTTVPDISSPLPTSSLPPPPPPSSSVPTSIAFPAPPPSSSSVPTSFAPMPPPPPDLPPAPNDPPGTHNDDAAAIRSAVIDFLLCVSEKQLALAILKESVHQQSILDRLWALIRTPSLQSSVAPELALWNLLLRSQLVDRIPHGAHAGICESLQQSFSSFRRRDFAALNADVTIIFGIGECVRGVCSACFAEWTQWTACPGASERDEARLFMTPSSSLTDLALAAGSGVVAAAGGGVVELAPPSSDTGTRAATGAGGDQTESCSAEKHPRVILDPSAPLYDSLVSIVHDRVRTFLTMPGSVPVPNVSTTESVVWEVLAQCLGLYPPTLGGCPPVRFSGRDLVELMWSLNRTLPGLAIELVFHILTKFPALLSYFGRTGGVGYSLQALCSPSPPESDCGVQVLSLLVRHSRSSQEVFALLLRVVDCDKLARPFIVTPGAPARRPEIVSLALETLTTLFRTCPGSGSVFQRFPRFVRAIQAAADPSPENGSEWQQQATELLDIMGCSRP